MKENKVTQKQLVLGHLLEFGCITPNEAIYKYHITRLGAVIFDLKKDGYAIETEKKSSINSVTGHPCQFANYIYKGVVVA